MSGSHGRRGRSACLLCLVALVACTADDAKVDVFRHPIAGLYTPESRIGASDPTDFPSEESLGNRCVLPPNTDAGMPTAGTLTVAYETRSLEMRYAPNNYDAVWIETPDGDYVATIEVNEGIHKGGLVYWRDRACVDRPGPDVVSSGTKRAHGKHMVEWTGVDYEGNLMPDGSYKLWIEVTESDKELGFATEFDFEKGPVMSGGDAPVVADGPLVSVSVVWTPGGEE